MSSAIAERLNARLGLGRARAPSTPPRPPPAPSAEELTERILGASSPEEGARIANAGIEAIAREVIDTHAAAAAAAGRITRCGACGGMRHGTGTHAPHWMRVGEGFQLVDCIGRRVQ